jgi:peptidoglycan pentaglycine glycine transferase (the first glycine)
MSGEFKNFLGEASICLAGVVLRRAFEKRNAVFVDEATQCTAMLTGEHRRITQNAPEPDWLADGDSVEHCLRGAGHFAAQTRDYIVGWIIDPFGRHEFSSLVRGCPADCRVVSQEDYCTTISAYVKNYRHWLECYNLGMKLVEISERQVWDEFVTTHAWGHPLQVWGWGETKRLGAWTPHRLALLDGETIVAGAQVLTWKIPKTSYCIVYAPRGPVVEPGSEASSELLEAVKIWAQNHKGLYLRIEPAWVSGAPQGWTRARHGIQMAETYTIDLRKTENELQEAMSRKHRQYTRKAERDGVSVKRVEGGQIGAMFSLYAETARRANFGIHSGKYYRELAQELGTNSFLYEAYFEGQPVAFLWLAAAGKTAYELYGGVNAVGAEMKANYVLKWEAIRAMKLAHYEIYDFNGRLNEGVSRFKDGFGPEATDYIGTYDFAFNTVGYRLWEQLWPVAKRVGRVLRSAKR